MPSKEEAVRPECHRCSEPQPQRRRFAFAAVVTEFGWVIGRADEGTKGYTPVGPEATFMDEEKAKARAAEMNKEAGWASEGDAAMMVLTTMPMKEDHLAGLLGRAVTLLKTFYEDPTEFTGNWPRVCDEVADVIEESKGYAKEPA